MLTEANVLKLAVIEWRISDVWPLLPAFSPPACLLLFCVVGNIPATG